MYAGNWLKAPNFFASIHTDRAAIYQALGIMDQRQENRRLYTLSVDPTSAISRIRSDDIRPGQCFSVASIEVAPGILARDNEIRVRRAPKSVASRYYQLLTGHAAIGPYLRVGFIR